MRIFIDLFNFVANSLVKISKWSGLSYNEVNILLYYLVIPMSWTFIIDIKLHTGVLTMGYVVFCAAVYSTQWTVNRLTFRQQCDRIFAKSVDFLLYFNRYGSNYVLSSIIFCVILPIIIYIFLLLL